MHDPLEKVIGWCTLQFQVRATPGRFYVKMLEVNVASWAMQLRKHVFIST